MREKAWRTKDGRRILLTEMTDDHLQNTILFVRRSHARYIDTLTLLGPPQFNGEMAQEAAMSEWLEATTSSIEFTYPIFADLLAEQKRRKKDSPIDERIHHWTHLHSSAYACGLAVSMERRGTANESATTCADCLAALKRSSAPHPSR